MRKRKKHLAFQCLASAGWDPAGKEESGHPSRQPTADHTGAVTSHHLRTNHLPTYLQKLCRAFLQRRSRDESLAKLCGHSHVAAGRISLDKTTENRRSTLRRFRLMRSLTYLDMSDTGRCSSSAMMIRDIVGRRPQRNPRDIPKWHPTLERRCLTFLDAHPEMTAWPSLGNMVMIADSHTNAPARCGFAFLDATALQTYLRYADRRFSNQHSSCDSV